MLAQDCFSQKSLACRLVPIEENPLVQQLPKAVQDLMIKLSDQAAKMSDSHLDAPASGLGQLNIVPGPCCRWDQSERSETKRSLRSCVLICGLEWRGSRWCGHSGHPRCCGKHPGTSRAETLAESLSTSNCSTPLVHPPSPPTFSEVDFWGEGRPTRATARALGEAPFLQRFVGPCHMKSGLSYIFERVCVLYICIYTHTHIYIYIYGSLRSGCTWVVQLPSLWQPPNWLIHLADG